MESGIGTSDRVVRETNLGAGLAKNFVGADHFEGRDPGNKKAWKISALRMLEFSVPSMTGQNPALESNLRPNHKPNGFGTTDDLPPEVRETASIPEN